MFYLLYKCPEEHRFQAAGNDRKKERILIERMKERKQEKKKERKKERKIPANCRVDQLLVHYKCFMRMCLRKKALNNGLS
jgi:hypothetical protein